MLIFIASNFKYFKNRHDLNDDILVLEHKENNVGFFTNLNLSLISQNI